MRTFRPLPIAFLLLANCLLWFGNGPGRAASVPQSSVVEAGRTPWLPTATLIADPVLAALVNQLALTPRIESPALGVLGRPSDIYPLFTRVIQAAPPQQVVALLRHESPIVRGYLVSHVAVKMPAALDAVYPLLGDSAEVETQSGCRGGHRRAADLAFEALGDQVERPAVQALLLRAARDLQLGTHVCVSSFSCLDSQVVP